MHCKVPLGGGGGSIQTFDITVPAAKILEILNDSVTGSEIIIPDVGDNNVIQLLSVSLWKKGFITGGITNPVLALGTLNHNFGGSICATPELYLKSAYIIPTQMIFSDDFMNPSFNIWRLTAPSQPLFLYALSSNAGATEACDIRIFGTYIVKSLI